MKEKFYTNSAIVYLTGKFYVWKVGGYLPCDYIILKGQFYANPIILVIGKGRPPVILKAEF